MASSTVMGSAGGGGARRTAGGGCTGVGGFGHVGTAGVPEVPEGTCSPKRPIQRTQHAATPVSFRSPSPVLPCTREVVPPQTKGLTLPPMPSQHQYFAVVASMHPNAALVPCCHTSTAATVVSVAGMYLPCGKGTTTELRQRHRHMPRPVQWVSVQRRHPAVHVRHLH